jgi:glycosyltransferase involved in cell wall biosynthesis
MRILFVVHGYPPQGMGGVELRASYLARELRKAHTVSVFCRGNNASREDYSVEDLLIDEVEVRRVSYSFRDLDRFEGVYVNRRIEALFEKTLDEVRPDVVHIHHLTCLSTTIPEVLRRKGVPHVMSLHDFWMGCPRGQRIRSDLATCHTIDREKCLPCTEEIWGREMMRGKEPKGLLGRLLGQSDPQAILRDYDAHIRRILGLPDLLLTPSVFSRDRFVEQGVAADRIRVLPYGLPTRLFQGIRRQKDTVLRFGYVGSVLPTKGAHVLLEAFEGLDRENVRLDIYGEVVPYHGDSSYVEELRARIAKTPGVKMHGRYENADLPRILEKVDILVVPSVWFETFCITVREGFLAGIPVIASDIGAVAESIEDGVSGLLFRPGDSGDLREKMRRLVDDPELRLLLAGQASRVKTIEDNTRELVEIYREVRRPGRVR